MRGTRFFRSFTAVGLALCTCAAARADEDAPHPALQLTPCTIELVDGSTAKGQLAVQFDMPDHLIVYSPRLATVRSFLKDHVHALTVDGRRRQLNPKRRLTDTDRKLLGRVDWPDEPPAEGHKPPYTTQAWQKPPRLMVWANPGRSGKVKDPGNWLVNGQQMTRWPRAVGEFFGTNYFNPGTTDILFPAADKNYKALARGRFHLRHITTECGADVDMPINTAVGNLWISPHGRYRAGGGANFSGDRHTFFLNDLPYTGDPPASPERFKELMDSVESFARKWVVSKTDPQATMTLIGRIGSWDETHFIRGITILEENSIVGIGPRCLQSVRKEGVLKMMSGSIIGKRANQLHKQDMMVVGKLMAGTPDRPLTRNCYIGISFKDHQAIFAGRMWREVGRRRGFRGFEVVPGGSIRVHSADPSRFKLVFRCHYQDGAGDSGHLPDRNQDPGKWKIYEQLPRRISIVIWKGADVQLNGVQFRDIEENGIKLEDMSIKDTWEHVSFGPNNAGPAAKLFVQHTPSMQGRGNYSYNVEAAVRGSDHTVTAGGTIANRYFRILPSGGTFAAGDAVDVQLDWLGDPEGQVRYTLDGRKTGEDAGNVYDGPITLTGTTTVRAGCIQNPAPHFRRQWREYRDTFTFVEQMRRPDDPARTKPGLTLTIYQDSDALDKDPAERDKPARPSATRTVNALALPRDQYKGRTGLVYTGYIEIDKAGTYRFETETDGKSRLFIGNHLVVNNHRRHRADYDPEAREDMQPVLTSWGSLKLAPGKHAFRLEYFHRNWHQSPEKIFDVRYEGPGMKKQPIPAAALHHRTGQHTAAKQTTVVTYPAPTGEGGLAKSDDFAVSVNGKPVDVYQVRVLKPHTWGGDYGPQQFEHASMAYFDFEGAVELEVEAGVPIDSVTIRPLSAQIEPAVEGSTIRFSLEQPRKLSVEINGEITHNLQLFANAIEKDKPQPDDPNVRYFGPGIHFPADDGIDGAIKLHSNETIYIAGGAIVHGMIQTPYDQRVHDAAIRGRGILLGQRDNVNKRGLIKIGFNCERIAISGIHLIDSYGWVVEVCWATDVLIEDLKIIAYRGNSDGIDIASCSNVTVRDCYIRSADDNLVVVNVRYHPSMKNFHVGKQGYDTHYGKMFKYEDFQGRKRSTSKIAFRDCILWQDRDNPDAIHVGWSMRGPSIEDVSFTDIDILHTRGGQKTAQLDIDSSWWGDPDNTIRGVLFENIRIEDARGGNIIYIRQVGKPAVISDIHFRNVHVLNSDVRRSSILASSPDSRIRDVTFENYRLMGKRVTSLEEPTFKIAEEYCENIVIR
jgi:hypothetical protein